MATPYGEVAADPAGVAEACEDDGADHLIPRARQGGVWLRVVDDALDLAVLDGP